MIGRNDDAEATAVLGCLYAEGEIELLLSLRATWRRSEERCPFAALKQANWLRV